MTGDGPLEAPGLGALPGIRHAFETRSAGLSARLPEPVLRPRQIHGTTVIHVGSDTPLGPLSEPPLEERPAADALVTALPALTLAVATADCLPVLVVDPEAGVVAAAHAGWRGLALGVLPATLGVMAREHGARPGRCRAAIGPRIGARSYRVAGDVRTAFLGAGISSDVFTAAGTHEDGRKTWWCDLLAAARHQLLACGLPSRAIEAVGGCTFEQPDRFHSYRRDGDAAGRMLSGICLDPVAGA